MKKWAELPISQRQILYLIVGVCGMSLSGRINANNITSFKIVTYLKLYSRKTKKE